MPEKSSKLKKAKHVVKEYAEALAPALLFVRESEKERFAYVGGFRTLKRAIQRVEDKYKTKHTRILGHFGQLRFTSDPQGAYKVNERTGLATKEWGIGPSSFKTRQTLRLERRSSPRITPKTPKLRR